MLVYKDHKQQAALMIFVNQTAGEIVKFLVTLTPLVRIVTRCIRPDPAWAF